MSRVGGNAVAGELVLGTQEQEIVVPLQDHSTSNDRSMRSVRKVDVAVLKIYDDVLKRDDLTPDERKRVLDDVSATRVGAHRKDSENKGFLKWLCVFGAITGTALLVANNRSEAAHESSPTEHPTDP